MTEVLGSLLRKANDKHIITAKKVTEERSVLLLLISGVGNAFVKYCWPLKTAFYSKRLEHIPYLYLITPGYHWIFIAWARMLVRYSSRILVLLLSS